MQAASPGDGTLPGQPFLPDLPLLRAIARRMGPGGRLPGALTPQLFTAAVRAGMHTAWLEALMELGAPVDWERAQAHVQAWDVRRPLMCAWLAQRQLEAAGA